MMDRSSNFYSTFIAFIVAYGGWHGVRLFDMSTSRTMQTIAELAELDWISPAGESHLHQTYESNVCNKNLINSIDLHPGIFFPVSYEASVTCLSLVKE